MLVVLVDISSCVSHTKSGIHQSFANVLRVTVRNIVVAFNSHADADTDSDSDANEEDGNSNLDQQALLLAQRAPLVHDGSTSCKSPLVSLQLPLFLLLLLQGLPRWPHGALLVVLDAMIPAEGVLVGTGQRSDVTTLDVLLEDVRGDLVLAGLSAVRDDFVGGRWVLVEGRLDGDVVVEVVVRGSRSEGR